MALSDLLARLEREAQSQVDAIQRAADAQVHAIDAATEQAVADTIARHLARERADRQVVQQQELATARRHALARELDARHALLARVRERAEALVTEVAASSSYADALPRHLAEALSFVDGVPCRVRCQTACAAVLAPLLSQHTDAELVIDDSIGPGLVVEAADGSVRVDNTLAARLGRSSAATAIELMKGWAHVSA